VSVRALRFDHGGADLDEVRGRTRWTMTLSVVVHLLLFALIVLRKPSVDTGPELTEITLLSPGDLEPAAAASAAPAAARASVPTAGALLAIQSDASFRRESDRADVSPDAQTQSAADRVSARLAAIREDVSVPVANASTAPGPSSMWSAPAGVPGGTGSSGRARNLTRGATGDGGTPLALWRGGGSGYAPALAQAGTYTVATDPPATADVG